jgi:acyl-CoA synthetase (AMP-forming)/AMP-acid ligase II
VAYVVMSAERPVTAEELRAHLRSQLELYKLPREIVFRDEIPRTPTGKVLRRELE